MNTHLLARKIISYYAQTDITQIAHTQCVAGYTRLIANLENVPTHEAELLECAAWLHDVGCPAAKAKYGSSKPEYQMSEGRTVAPTLLDGNTELSADEKDWLVDVVGTHHKLKEAVRLHYEPLFEADLIVNLLEGYYPMAQAATYYKMVHTQAGKALYTELFLKDQKL